MKLRMLLPSLQLYLQTKIVPFTNCATVYNLDSACDKMNYCKLFIYLNFELIIYNVIYK